MSICLITGANGFVGSALTSYLQQRGFTVRAAVRTAFPSFSEQSEVYTVGNIDANTDWTKALQTVYPAPSNSMGIDTIVHLAGTVHRPDIQDPSVYQRSIVDATIRLAEQAVVAKVKRLVYVSSAHVYGVETSTQLLAENDACHPQTPYAQAKWEAEQKLQAFLKNELLELVIVRPPLVYGPGVRGNFAQLIKLVKKFPVLPFGCATQLRSLVGLDNLVAFLHTCMVHPQAANAVFNISDDADMSTRMLCKKLAALMQRKCVLLPVPAALINVGLKLCGRGSLYNKLFGSVRLDISQAKHKLGWKTMRTVDEQMGTFL